jgi:hypothetical protein
MDSSPKPLRAMLEAINADRIQKLLNDPRLSEWEAGFVFGHQAKLWDATDGQSERDL